MIKHAAVCIVLEFLSSAVAAGPVSDVMTRFVDMAVAEVCA